MNMFGNRLPRAGSGLEVVKLETRLTCLPLYSCSWAEDVARAGTGQSYEYLLGQESRHSGNYGFGDWFANEEPGCCFEEFQKPVQAEPGQTARRKGLPGRKTANNKECCEDVQVTRGKTGSNRNISSSARLLEKHRALTPDLLVGALWFHERSILKRLGGSRCCQPNGGGRRSARM